MRPEEGSVNRRPTTLRVLQYARAQATLFWRDTLIIPLAAWALVKPLRVLAPQLEGITCDEWVCVDDNSRRAEATRLYRDADFGGSSARLLRRPHEDLLGEMR